jgi:hypothetical protein
VNRIYYIMGGILVFFVFIDFGGDGVPKGDNG